METLNVIIHFFTEYFNLRIIYITENNVRKKNELNKSKIKGIYLYLVNGESIQMLLFLNSSMIAL